MDSDADLKDQALNSSHDFYALLDIQPAASESEIRRAYRKTALKYHPDKVGADQTALDKFHLLQIAYDVLLDSTARQVYDNARRAREEKKERDAAYDSRRRHLKEELERRESAGVAGLKRKREEDHEEEAFQRELRRLAADGARRRKEREEQLRREAQELQELEQMEKPVPVESNVNTAKPLGVEEIDRTVTFRYPADIEGLDDDALSSRFGRFGKIEHVVTRNKKLKPEGEKHRKEFIVAIVVFTSIVAAHAAVTDVPKLAEQDDSWTVFGEVTWAGGKEPHCIPKPKAPSPVDPATPATPKTPAVERLKAVSGEGNGGLRKVPSFGSFKGTPKTSTAIPVKTVAGSPSMEEITMIRLKNAERKRLADKLRKEEAEAEAAEAQTV